MGGRLNKVVFVTGAGSIGPGWGSGKPAARQVAREGATVVASDINQDAVEETAQIIRDEGGSVHTDVCDVSKADQVTASVARAMQAFGRIDVLHNNVGIVDPGGPEDLTEEQWDRLMAINVKSLHLTCREVLPIRTAQGKGSIINISSITSTHSLGIHCNAIQPGLTNTPLIHKGNVTGVYGSAEATVAARDALVSLGHMGDGWDVAHAAVFLASHESRFVTGIEPVLDGGITLKVR